MLNIAKNEKNDLGAIRYMHNQVPRAKHELSSNDKLAVEFEKTKAVGNRAWTDEEFKKMMVFLIIRVLCKKNPSA